MRLPAGRCARNEVRPVLFERIKMVAVLLFFVGLLIVTRSADTDVLKQKDPRVLNFLAAAYCPDVVQGGQADPLTFMNVLVKGAEDTHSMLDEGQYVWREVDGVRRRFPVQNWEQIAAERHAKGLPGYHQAWKVRFVEMPTIEGQESWALTRLMGGMAPEFMYSMRTPDYHERADHWYVDLTDYLHQPNPYVPGNERWMDLFYPGTLDKWRSNNKRFHCVPIDQVEIAVFYNKKIFRECGIDESELVDMDWKRFMEIHRIIKDHKDNYVPFNMTAGQDMRINWMHRVFNDMVYAGIYDKLNVVDDHTLPGTSSIEAQEKVRAIRKGILKVGSDRYWESWRIIKEWSQYWQEGYLSETDNLKFRKGEAAMCVDGSWFVKALEKDEERKKKFQYGTFFIPRLTKRTSRYATDVLPRGVGGATAIQYSITKASATRKDSVEACVDLLMWMTAPRNIGPLVAENESFLPAVRGAKLSEKLKFMQPVLERGAVQMDGFDMLSTRCRESWWKAMQGWLEGIYDRPTVAAKMEKAIERYIRDTMLENANKWRWMKDENGRDTWEIRALDERDYVSPTRQSRYGDGARPPAGRAEGTEVAE